MFIGECLSIDIYKLVILHIYHFEMRPIVCVSLGFAYDFKIEVMSVFDTYLIHIRHERHFKIHVDT